MTRNRENPSSEQLGLLYRVSRALLKEGEYGELLSGLLDTLIEGLGADRGFVVVREGGEFRATAARNFRSEALSRAEEAVQPLDCQVCDGKRESSADRRCLDDRALQQAAEHTATIASICFVRAAGGQ